MKFSELVRTMEELRMVAFVHPSDISDALVRSMKDAGYEIEEREVMVKRRVFFRTSEISGIVDLDTCSVSIGTNLFTSEWSRSGPPEGWIAKGL